MPDSRPKTGLVAIAAAVLATVSSLAGGQPSPKILADLRISEQDAQARSLTGLWSGSVAVPGAAGGTAIFKAASPEQRGAIVRAVATLVRAHYESNDFRRRYAERWESHKPKPPEPPVPMREQLAARRKDHDRKSAEMRESARALSPELQQRMQESAAATGAQLEAMERNEAFQARMDAEAQRAYQIQRQRYETKLAKYEADHPKDPNVAIAERLRQFLEVSATVDFDAALTDKNPKDQKMRFVDPRLEAKPGAWKLCYRAGKEAVAAARVIATEWLQQMGAK